MSEERFKKYIQEIENGTSCGEFLDEYTQLLSELRNDNEFKKELKIHNALSNSKRYFMYKLLREKPMCTCALARLFDLSDGTITHHLKILEGAGLVIGKKEGYFTRYYTIEKIIQTLS